MSADTNDEDTDRFLGRKFYRLPVSTKECKAIEEMVELQKSLACTMQFRLKMFPN